MKTKVLKYKDSQGKEHVLSPIVISGQGLPEEGESGQVLTKTEDGAEWADIKEPDLTNYATKEEVAQAKSEVKDELIGTAPGTYDTLGEIADYIKEHGEVAAGMAADIATKADKSELANYQEKLPEDGNLGQVLTKTNTGPQWEDLPDCEVEELSGDELREILGIEGTESDFKLLVDGKELTDEPYVIEASGGSLPLSIEYTDPSLKGVLDFQITNVQGADSGSSPTNIKIASKGTTLSEQTSRVVTVTVNNKFTKEVNITQLENKVTSAWPAGSKTLTKTVSQYGDVVMFTELPNWQTNVMYSSGQSQRYDPQPTLGPNQETVYTLKDSILGTCDITISEPELMIPENNFDYEQRYSLWAKLTLRDWSDQVCTATLDVVQEANLMVDEQVE